MRSETQTRYYYTKEDCDALDNMPLEEIISILEGLEGSWMPSRPTEYYHLTSGHIHEAEMDFDLLRTHKAIDNAARLLRKLLAESKAGDPA